MYKYIIYCSISAVIIIAAKYVYQNWIKQNHTIATIKQDIQLLQTKVKNVEEHFDKTKGSISGGVTVPIVFKKIDYIYQKTLNILEESEKSNQSTHQIAMQMAMNRLV